MTDSEKYQTVEFITKTKQWKNFRVNQKHIFRKVSLTHYGCFES